jgi:hypothetical protein
MKLETLGKIVWEDKKNNLIASIEFGKVKKKPTDYI